MLILEECRNTKQNKKKSQLMMQSYDLSSRVVKAQSSKKNFQESKMKRWKSSQVLLITIETQVFFSVDVHSWMYCSLESYNSTWLLSKRLQGTSNLKSLSLAKACCKSICLLSKDKRQVMLEDSATITLQDNMT